MSEDYEVGRIWNWTHYGKQAVTNKKDVLLPFGFLTENPRVTVKGVGSLLKATMILPNCDIVVGPDLMATADIKTKEELGVETKDFKQDMIYLKLATQHGTIVLNDFPKTIEKRREK